MSYTQRMLTGLYHDMNETLTNTICLWDETCNIVSNSFVAVIHDTQNATEPYTTTGI